MSTIKETIEYDPKFLAEWGEFCNSKGYVMRQASHACRIAFMKLHPAEREKVMMAATQSIKKRKSAGND